MEPQPPLGQRVRLNAAAVLNKRFQWAVVSLLLWLAFFAAAFVFFLRLLSEAAVPAAVAGLLGFLVGGWYLLGAFVGGILWTLAIQLHLLARDVATAVSAIVCEAASQLEARFETGVVVDVSEVNVQIEQLVAKQSSRLGDKHALLPVLNQWAPEVANRGMRYFAIRVVGKDADDGRITVSDLVTTGERLASGAALGTLRRLLWMATLALLGAGVLWIALPLAAAALLL
jgi:hypothetical protein